MTVTVGIIDTLWYCFVTFLISRGNVMNKLKANSYIVDKITGVFLVALAVKVVLN